MWRALVLAGLVVVGAEGAQVSVARTQGWRSGGDKHNITTLVLCDPVTRVSTLRWQWSSTNSNGVSGKRIRWQLDPNQHSASYELYTNITDATARPKNNFPYQDVPIYTPASGRYRVEIRLEDGNVHVYGVSWVVDWEALGSTDYVRGFEFDALTVSDQGTVSPADPWLRGWWVPTGSSTVVGVRVNYGVYQHDSGLQYAAGSRVSVRWRVNGGGWTTLTNFDVGVWSCVVPEWTVTASQSSPTVVDVEVATPYSTWRRWSFTLEGRAFETLSWSGPVWDGGSPPGPAGGGSGGGYEEDTIRGWFEPSAESKQDLKDALDALKALPPWGDIRSAAEAGAASSGTMPRATSWYMPYMSGTMVGAVPSEVSSPAFGVHGDTVVGNRPLDWPSGSGGAFEWSSMNSVGAARSILRAMAGWFVYAVFLFGLVIWARGRVSV